MSFRKPFNKLSERQKRRRLNGLIAQEMEDLEAEFDSENDTIEPKTTESSLQHESTSNSIEPENSTDDSCNINLIEEEHMKNNSDPYELFLSNLSICSEDSNDEYLSEESDEFLLSDNGIDEDIDEQENESDDENLLVEGFDLKNALREWKSNFFITQVATDNLLLILREAGHADLPKTSRSFVNTPRFTKIDVCSPGEYFHYGLEKSLKDTLSRDFTIKETNLKIDINIDGLPITKSTKRTLWPIQGKIISNVCTTPFVIGVYHGTSKPSSAITFLMPFIEEYKNLSTNGFRHNNKQYFVKLRCIICDSPAASFVTCTKQHNGYFGCRKCMEEGDFVKKMVYLSEDAELRTDENFRNRKNPEHHLEEISPFESLDINIVDQFPLDYMHLVCLGATKTLIKQWLKINPKFSARHTEQLSIAFTDLGKFVPKEFNRKPTSLLELGFWKATTFRLFLLYAGPIILSDFLPHDLVLNFNYLSCAIRILCDPTQCKINNQYAKKLLKRFVQDFKELYGKQYVTYTIHNLVHISDDVKNHGPLDTFSAFDHENFMTFIKKLIRKNEKPLQQIHRRLVEKHYPSNKRQNRLCNFPLLLSKIYITLPLQCKNSHRRLKFKNFEICSRSPDNCCIMNNNDIVVVDFIGTKNNEIVVIGRNFLERQSIRNYPMNSVEIGICEVKKFANLKIFPAQSIISKACLFIHNNKNYVISLLHS